MGKPAAFRITTGLRFARSGARAWTGVCSQMELVRVLSRRGLTRLSSTLVPTLWLLGQRRNYRLFQHVAIPDIVIRVSAEWGIEPAWRVDCERYPKREFAWSTTRPYSAFVCRMSLRQAGIAFWFEGACNPDQESTLVLGDAPQRGELRGYSACLRGRSLAGASRREDTSVNNVFRRPSLSYIYFSYVELYVISNFIAIVFILIILTRK